MTTHATQLDTSRQQQRRSQLLRRRQPCREPWPMWLSRQNTAAPPILLPLLLPSLHLPSPLPWRRTCPPSPLLVCCIVWTRCCVLMRRFDCRCCARHSWTGTLTQPACIWVRVTLALAAAVAAGSLLERAIFPPATSTRSRASSPPARMIRSRGHHCRHRHQPRRPCSRPRALHKQPCGHSRSNGSATWPHFRPLLLLRFLLLLLLPLPPLCSRVARNPRAMPQPPLLLLLRLRPAPPRPPPQCCPSHWRTCRRQQQQ